MLNKVMLIGNLGKDPELRYTTSGQAVCDFNIATSEVYTDRDGQKQEKTEWHRVVVWARQAENCKRYLSKGSKVFVEGRLQTRDWQDQSGNKRYTTEVVAQNVQFLSPKGSTGGGAFQEPPPPSDEYAPPPSYSDRQRRQPAQEPVSTGSTSYGRPPGGQDEMPPLDDDLPF
jgi:single-strand DNA-binding protein